MFDPASLPVAELRRAFEGSGLECTVWPYFRRGGIFTNRRQKSVAHLRQCVEISRELGAHLIGGPVFAPIGYIPARRRNADGWRWAVEVFQALGATLDECDIMLSIEPVNRSETFFLRTASDAKAFCDAINNPRIGVTLDTFHANIEEKNVASCDTGAWISTSACPRKRKRSRPLWLRAC